VESIKKLLNYQKEITDIQYTINLLKWELRINAPAQSYDNLINLISSFENKLFKLQTEKIYEELLLNAINSKDFSKLSEAERRYIYNAYRRYQEKVKIPIDFYSEYVELKNKTTMVWRDAKAKNDYMLYKPYLEKVISMTKQYYRYIDDSVSNLYDVMLNKFEMGITSQVIDRLFGELKPVLISLIKECSVDNKKVLENDYNNDELIECANFLLDYIGFDMTKGAIGVFAHGFTEKIGHNDVRIAFRNQKNPISFVSTVIHEGGHAIFEQNILENLSKYENGCVDNLYALHESQSRFYENILGRNKNFWLPIYEEITKKLKLKCSLDEFIDLLNQVTCGFIRTESDELTYCLHIILRYEIERDIFNGDLNIDDLPKIWNEKMKEYFNLEVLQDSQGLMQDIHWSEGEFGYFPSYLIGTIYSGMFKEMIERDLGSIDKLLRNGQIKIITDYLINNIYLYGGAYNSLEIIQRMGEKELSVKPLIRYFEQKYKTKK